MFVCNRCGYSSDLKSNLTRHLTKKKECKAKNENSSREDLLNDLKSRSNEDEYVTCHVCSQVLPSLHAYYKHKHTCNNKPSITYNTNITANNIVIVRNSFGSENITYLPKEFLNSCILMNDIVSLIENIHFDTDHPENHNIKIKSTKQELMETYVNGKWIVTDTNDTLNELINKGYRILNKHTRKNKKDIIETEMDEQEYDDVIKWLEKIYENKRMRKPIRKKLLLLFLNNQAMLLEKDD